MESSESDADPVLCNELNNYVSIVDANNNYQAEEASSDSDNPLIEHLTFLEARERLEEFPGRVPQRRKKLATPATSGAGSSKKVALQSDSDSNTPVITCQKQQNRNSDTTTKNATLQPTDVQDNGQSASSKVSVFWLLGERLKRLES